VMTLLRIDKFWNQLIILLRCGFGMGSNRSAA
jgi:hypothetical protein